jgi:hypothetical protein
MSHRSRYSISCPRCHRSFEVELWDSINVKESPELREELMANRVNLATCEGCSFAFRVDKPLLYADPARRILVYWIPVADDDFARGEEAFAEQMQRAAGAFGEGGQPPAVHLVFTRVELVERIFLLEAALDERVIEYIKYTLYSRNAKRLDPARKILLFNAQDSTEDTLCFVVQDTGTRQFEAMLQYGRDAYAALKETFRDAGRTVDLMELFPGPHISARRLLLDGEIED